jgi:hypothetical protein
MTFFPNTPYMLNLYANFLLEVRLCDQRQPNMTD